jgi:hypothetical protein
MARMSNKKVHCLLLVLVGVILLAVTSAYGEKIPMVNFFWNGSNYGANIYLYDTASKTMGTVKENNINATFPHLNGSQTMLVYTELISEDPDVYKICVYDVSLKTTTCFDTPTVEEGFAFDNNGKILFVDNSTGVLKKMNPDGTGITTVATPVSPYRFSLFYLSPDRGKIIAVEMRRPGDYHTTNYERLLLMNADGTNPSTIRGEHLGIYNFVAWKSDSSEVFLYYHVFDVVGGVYQGKTPEYALLDIPGGTETDLSSSDVWKEENPCVFTKSGNLLSLAYHELYNGQTGELIAIRSDVPSIMEAMIGWDNNGEIYFADLDGTNFRRFVEFVKGDFNGDGKPDLFWQNQATGDIVFWQMDGTTLMNQISIGNVPDTNWKIVDYADFNGDGKQDILWQNQATGDVCIWLMDGMTVTGAIAGGGVSDPYWRIVSAVDYSGDGKPDYLWQHQQRGDLYTWFIDWNEWWGSVVVTGGTSSGGVSDTDWKIIGTGDFNNDSNPDYLWQHQVRGDIYIWFTDGFHPTGASHYIEARTDTDWKIVAIADFNSDGKPDILWRHQVNGQNEVWFMNGVTQTGSAFLQTVSDTNWRIAGPK